MIEPNFDWHWCLQQGRLCLQTPAGTHRTPVYRDTLPEQSAFTLGQAELYWKSLFALEVLNWPEHAVYAASIDAIAQIEFGAIEAHKSFYLQYLDGQHQPEAFDLVQVSGRNAALALVLESGPNQSRLMLLTELETLTGRVVAAGQSFSTLHDRLSLYYPPQAPLLKTA